MKKSFLFLSALLCISATAMAQGDFGPAYIQTCAPGNTSSNYTNLDTSLLQSTGGAELIVTHVNQSSIFTSNDYKYTVGVKSSGGVYQIFNEDGAPMPDSNLSFAVLNPTVSPNGTSFVQYANAGTDFGTSSQYSLINNATLNGNPSAILFITHNRDSSSVSDTTLTSVYFSAVENQWALYKENAFDTFPAGDAYNVFAVTDNSGLAFTYTYTGTSNSLAFINNGLINGNDSAIILVTHQNVDGVPTNNHPIGVWYDANYGQWAIYNEDGSYIPTNSEFNVLIANSYATGIANISNDAAIRVYPIPASSTLSVETATGMDISTATLTDMSGRILMVQPVNNTSQTSMNVAGISTGMYLLKLDTDHGSYTRKVSVSGN